MPNIKQIDIQTDSDIYDCDTCDANYAEGGSVEIDGKEILNAPAEASCFGGNSYSMDELLVIALKKAGITVNVDGAPYHVTCHHDDYHGPREDF